MNQNSKRIDWQNINFQVSSVFHNKGTNPLLVEMSRDLFVESLMMPFVKTTITEKILKTLERFLEDGKINLEWSDEEVRWIGPIKELETYLAIHFVFEVIRIWHTINDNYYDVLGNENKRWSKEEECYLRAAFTTGNSISEIAEDLMRTKRAIHSRLNFLGYYVPQSRY